MYQCSTEAKKGRVNSSTRGEAPSGGIEKFPKSHERHIPIPPRVAKYPHEWVTKSPRVAKPRVVNFVTHEWGYFATSGGIGMCLEWRMGNLTRPFCASVEHYHSYIASENSTSSQSSTVEEVWWIGFMLSQSSTVKDWDNINSFHHTLTSNCP